MLRKPPRPHQKSRPVSGPPMFRNSRALEEVPGRSAAVGDSTPEVTAAEKENRPTDVNNKLFTRATSVDNASEADVCFSSFIC